MRDFYKSGGASAMAVRTAAILFLFVIVFTGVLSAGYLLTRPAIEAAAAEQQMRLIDEILPRGDYDNELLKDTLSLPASPELGSDIPTLAYRARHQSKVIAIILTATAPDGYSGNIQLVLAIRADGRLAGVRVVSHKETPGLGDYIEPKKDKNKARPWIRQFDDLSFDTVAAAGWRVKKDGGHFDSMAGATVTPRAVIKASTKALKYVIAHRAQLFAIPAKGDPQ